MIRLTNFVFISAIFLSLFWPSLASHRGRSFRAVHRGTPQDLPVRYAERCEPRIRLRQSYGVTGCTDATDGFLAAVRRSSREIQPAPTTAGKLTRTPTARRKSHLYPCDPYQILFLLFLAEFLETRIGAQGIPDRIEPKKSRRNGR
jgi:hypothetical protein